jgi:hypothetical protein
VTRRYGPLRGPTSSSCGGLQPLAEAFFALRQKTKKSIKNPKKSKKFKKSKNPKKTKKS